MIESENTPKNEDWGQLLDQFLNRQIDFNINIDNLKTLLALNLNVPKILVQ